MKATINGIQVEGTPEEILSFKNGLSRKYINCRLCSGVFTDDQEFSGHKCHGQRDEGGQNCNQGISPGIVVGYNFKDGGE